MKMFDDGSIVVEDLSGVRLGAPGGVDAFGGEEILCGVRDAVQRAAVMAPGDFLLCGFGLRHGEFRSEASVGVEARTELFGAVEEELGEVDRRKLFGLDASGE